MWFESNIVIFLDRLVTFKKFSCRLEVSRYLLHYIGFNWRHFFRYGRTRHSGFIPSNRATTSLQHLNPLRTEDTGPKRTCPRSLPVA